MSDRFRNLSLQELMAYIRSGDDEAALYVGRNIESFALPSDEELDDAAEAGVRKGYDDGYDDGKIEGYNDAQEDLKFAKEVIDSLVAKLSEIVTEFDTIESLAKKIGDRLDG